MSIGFSYGGVDRLILPPEVVELAARVGARADGKGFTLLSQSGSIRSSLDSKWMAFSANQWINARVSEFQWLAKTGPLKLIRVEDSLMGDRPNGKVSVAGLIPLGKAAQSPSALKAQVMRYLAELPWTPDAILQNRSLNWERADRERLRATATIGEATGTVTFHLNSDGFLSHVSGNRPSFENGRFVDRPWTGSHFDYRKVDGRWIPHAGEVGWVVAGEHIKVWRGTISSWRCSSKKP